MIIHSRLLWFIAFSIAKAAFFCSGANDTQLSNTSLSSGVSSTISPSANSCDREIPNPWHMVSNVAKDGIVFRRNMFPMVVCAKSHSFESRYSVQPRSVRSCCRRVCISITPPSFLRLFYFQARMYNSNELKRI